MIGAGSISTLVTRVPARPSRAPLEGTPVAGGADEKSTYDQRGNLAFSGSPRGQLRLPVGAGGP